MTFDRCRHLGWIVVIDQDVIERTLSVALRTGADFAEIYAEDKRNTSVALDDGRIEQVGTPDELYRTPATRWVAGFVGEANFISGSRTSNPDKIHTALGPIAVETPSAEPGDNIAVLVRPEQIALSPGDDAEITTVEYYGHDVRYELLLPDGTVLSARAHPDRLHQRGERVAISFESSATTTAFPS